MPEVKFRIKHFQKFSQKLYSKKFSDEITSALKNCALELGLVSGVSSNGYKTARVQPITKTVPNLFSNYSPISIHSVLS